MWASRILGGKEAASEKMKHTGRKRNKKTKDTHGKKRDMQMKDTQAGVPDPLMEDVSLGSSEVVDNNAPEWRKRGLRTKNELLGAQGSAIGHSVELISREPPEPVMDNATSDRVLGSPITMSTRVVEDNDGELLRVAAGNVGEVKKDSIIKVVSSMNAAVKVFCVHTAPNFSLPWQRKRQYSSSSSGLIIGGRRVLTNAHSVAYHTQVKLKKRGSDTKYLASVLAIGTECDIAMLTVDDDEFWDEVSPVEFGCLPALQDAVTVVGYPIGGDTISVTSGVVSRIETLSYVHGSTELLGLQIDAAINSGNSGGPAFNDKGQCVGIAFQSLKHEDAENIGYVIPTPVILHFIKDYEQSREYTGFPILGVECQKMENPDLRKAMGMAPTQKGVRVRRIEPTAPASRFLKPSDIILSFDGTDIANDGTVPFRHGERIGFSYLVSQKYTGESAIVKVLRESKILEFNVEVAVHKRLVPAHIKGKPPSYYIIAGFVFSTISVPYLRSEYGRDYDCDAPVKLLDKLRYSMAQAEDEQLVVVSQVLVSDINIGYEDIVNTQVLAFNNEPVKNLKQLAEMVGNYDGEFLQFDLEYQQIVVLEAKKAKAATLDILKMHGIPSAMSEDLRT